MIRMVIPDPDPRSWFFTHPGSRGQKGTKSRIRNTAHNPKISAYSKFPA
jgi:hypothetical protein